MTLARAESEWDRTAAQMALLANCHRNPKKCGPFYAKDFHPFKHGAAESGMTIKADNIRLLKIFVRE